MTPVWMILVPVGVMVSSLLFIDARNLWVRALGFALALGGALGLFAFVHVIAGEAADEAARCASRGGAPANGECWVDGERE